MCVRCRAGPQSVLLSNVPSCSARTQSARRGNAAPHAWVSFSSVCGSSYLFSVTQRLVCSQFINQGRYFLSVVLLKCLNILCVVHFMISILRLNAGHRPKPITLLLTNIEMPIKPTNTVLVSLLLILTVIDLGHCVCWFYHNGELKCWDLDMRAPGVGTVCLKCNVINHGIAHGKNRNSCSKLWQ